MQDTPYKFAIGQLIHHKRYGYRGVIAARDPVFTNTEDWYQKNQTQPDKEQPWYHVLVDGAMHTTYVAESNLEPDPSHDPVVHPMIETYFETFHEGRYYPVNLN